MPTVSTGKRGRPKEPAEPTGDSSVIELFTLCKSVLEHQLGHEVTDYDEGHSTLRYDRKDTHQFRYGTIRVDGLLQLFHIQKALLIPLDIMIRVARYEWTARQAFAVWLDEKKWTSQQNTWRAKKIKFEAQVDAQDPEKILADLKAAIPKIYADSKKELRKNRNSIITRWESHGANRDSDITALRKGKRAILSQEDDNPLKD